MFHNRSEKAFLTWEGKYRESAEEDRFLGKQDRQNTNRTRVVSLLTAVSYASGYLSDANLFPDEHSMKLMFIARGLAIFMALVCFGVTFSKQRNKLISIASFIYFMTIIVAECTELYFRPEMAGQIVPFLAFVTIAYYVFFPVRLLSQLSCGIIAYIAYMITLGTSIGFGEEIFIMVNVTYILGNVLGIYTAYSMNVASRIEYRTRVEMASLNSKLRVEVDERKQASKKLVEMASTDELTGVYNRRFFISISKSELERMKQSDLESSLLFFDVDYFKHVNDTYGHSAGDEVLKQITKSISKSIRDVDILGRIGGEEFAVLLPGCTLENAKIKAQAICDLIAGMEYRFTAVDTGEERAFSTTISIGVASCIPGECEGFDTIMRYADIALYQAKEDGRNRVVIWHV